MTDNKQDTIKAVETEILTAMENLKKIDNVPNRVFYLLHEAINTTIRELTWEDEHAKIKADFESQKQEAIQSEQRKSPTEEVE